MTLPPLATVMRLASTGDLDAANSIAFREFVRAQLTPETAHLELDLAATHFLDSSGLGALLALGKCMRLRGGTLRVLNARPRLGSAISALRIDQLIELVQP